VHVGIGLGVLPEHGEDVRGAGGNLGEFHRAPAATRILSRSTARRVGIGPTPEAPASRT